MKRVLPNLALLGISLALAGGVAELVLRARFGTPPVWTFPQESYVPDAELGYRLEPGQHAFTHAQPVEINSLGLRDRERPRLPPPGVRRLLALGDSETFGNGLALADTWPKQLERELRRGDDAAGWEVVDAGLPGSATWQQEIVLRRASEAYALDGFVLGFYVNDVVAIPAERQVEAAGLTNTWSKRAVYVLKRSALWLAAWQARHAIRAWLSGEHGSWEEKILTGEPDPLIEAGWRQVERSLAAMKSFADERGLAFWLVALPRRDQVSGTQPGGAYQRRLAEIVARLGIPWLDALPLLESAYAEYGERLFIPWDGHNSGLANAAIARELARAITRSDGPSIGVGPRGQRIGKDAGQMGAEGLDE